MESVDGRLLDALRRDGRASFARLGAAIGVSDRTAARRYPRLRDSGVLSVVGVAEAQAEWIVRVRCRPGGGSSGSRAPRWSGRSNGPDAFRCTRRHSPRTLLYLVV